MRAAHALGGIVAVLASIWLFRIVLHGYTDHEHVDVFHLVVALVSAAAGAFLLRRARIKRTA